MLGRDSLRSLLKASKDIIADINSIKETMSDFNSCQESLGELSSSSDEETGTLKQSNVVKSANDKNIRKKREN